MIEAQLEAKPASRGARVITRQIRQAIEAGHYMDGDQLPPERELSETYGASRSTIRKALDGLERDGLVQRKVGSGTFISYSGPVEPDLDAVVAQISPLQLIDARIGFERQMTRLAVVHATAQDIGDMYDVLEKMERDNIDKESFTRLDIEFHLLLARASGNPLIVQLYKLINEVRTHSQWQAARELVLSPAKIETYNIHHRAIIDGLRNRDGAAAVAALNAHMELAHQDLVGTVSD